MTAFVEVTRPLGRVDGSVVDAEQFDAFADLVLDGLRSQPSARLREVYEDLNAVVDRCEEEPDGPGFFAFGAVVEVLYAAEFLFGEERAAAHSFMRASDLLWFVDEELGTGLHDRLVEWAGEAIAGRGGPPDDLRIDVERAARAFGSST